MERDQTLDFNRRNIEEFRQRKGHLSGPFEGAPVLLLTTTGAKSSQRRTSPMMYLADEHDPNRVYVFASYAGADRNPAWYHNIVAHPDDLRVEIGSEELDATAEVLQEPERGEVYAIQARRYPGFADYQAKTSRPIPVVALTLRRP
jgi:deazaflavin-dependent oxidoreductase (nitroreductase family)